MNPIYVLNMTHEILNSDHLPGFGNCVEVKIRRDPDELVLADAKFEVRHMLTTLQRIEQFTSLSEVYIIIKPNRNDIAMVLFAVSALQTLSIWPKIWILQGMRGIYMDISDFLTDGYAELMKEKN